MVAQPFRSSVFTACVLFALVLLPRPGLGQKSEARKKLDTYLSQIGASYDERARTVAAIQTKEQAEQRKAEVRKKILGLIGGIPESAGPVKVKQYGKVTQDGFRVEKIAYESLPNYYVTADVFVPTSGTGPFPAVVVTPGHGPAGKVSEANWGANFARNGMITLAIDVLGAGERLQHYDPELEASKVERSGEHEHAGLSTLLIGEHVSRYFIKDGMRGVDYLLQRPDVDKSHVGAFGCSGGGTATAYLGALDPRIAVTATACFITSLKELMPATGAQDAEQTIPKFLSEGMDLADWVEIAAPRPYAIVATTEDMFPFAGAKATYAEAKRIYGLYGVDDKLQFITGPGGHGNLGPISPQITAFLLKYLKPGSPEPVFKPYRMENPDDLIVTPTGQVATSLHGETVEDLNRKEAARLITVSKPAESKPALDSLRQRVCTAIRSIAAVTAEPGSPPDVSVQKKEQREGFRVDTLTIRSEPNLDIAAVEVVPDRPGPKPALVMLEEGPAERVLMTPDVQRLVKGGHVILILQARGTPSDNPSAANQSSILGSNTGIALQAMLVGKSLVGMRVDDTIRTLNWLATSPDVEKSSITLYGRGAEGMVALHVAALDTRISRVILENSLISYHLALQAPLHRNLSEIILPGVLLKYDTADLMEAISPRPVVLVNPADAMSVAARDEVVHKELEAAYETGRKYKVQSKSRLFIGDFATLFRSISKRRGC